MSTETKPDYEKAIEEMYQELFDVCTLITEQPQPLPSLPPDMYSVHETLTQRNIENTQLRDQLFKKQKQLLEIAVALGIAQNCTWDELQHRVEQLAKRENDRIQDLELELLDVERSITFRNAKLADAKLQIAELERRLNKAEARVYYLEFLQANAG